jgi:DNA polymerase-1
VVQREKLEKLFVLEQELTEVVTSMKLRGITVDQPGLRALGDDLAIQIKEADDAVRRHVPVGWVSPNKNPFNPNSTDHLSKLLYVDLGLPVTKTTDTGQPSTDKFTLDALALSHPVVRDLQTLRGLTKLKSTYVDGVLDQLDDDGRLRAGFKQCGTETGRFSCSAPNLQNLPSANDLSADEGKKIRHMFMAAPGCVLVGADYSQIEGRVMGDLCARFGAGTALRDVFLEPNVDWHRATAARMYRIPPEKVDSKQRAKGKTANFALLYGGYWTLLVRKFKMTETEAKETFKRFHEAYPELDAFVAITCDQARRRRRPYTETLWGRRRYFPDLSLSVYGEGAARKARYLKVQAAEREAVNHRVQGTSADITKSAMVRYWRRAESLGHRADWPLLITEHDALLIEVPEKDQSEAARVLLEAMQGVHIDLSVSIPVDVKCGLRWQDVK